MTTLCLFACEPASESALDSEGDDDSVDERVHVLSMDHFELAQDGSRASHATGSVEISMLDEGGKPTFYPPWDPRGGYEVRGTCGATFISPHYAITAAHCVDEKFLPDLKHHGVRVQTYDITQADKDELIGLGKVEGMYPDYHPQYSVDDVEGYEVQGFDCYVTARCGYGERVECSTPGDVAMLYCPGRSDGAAWLPVASSDPQEGAVEMYWFHELLEMPFFPGNSAEQQDRFEHYTVIDSSKPKGENFHYLKAKANVLMPLRSLPWPNGGPERRRTGNNETDLFGCHGTSGSGVLQRSDKNELELLGPAINPIGWGSDRLCMTPEHQEPGVPRIRYTDNTIVKALEAEHAITLILDRAVLAP